MATDMATEPQHAHGPHAEVSTDLPQSQPVTVHSASGRFVDTVRRYFFN